MRFGIVDGELTFEGVRAEIDSLHDRNEGRTFLTRPLPLVAALFGVFWFG